jgi:hypothetical protein
MTKPGFLKPEKQFRFGRDPFILDVGELVGP